MKKIKTGAVTNTAQLPGIVKVIDQLQNSYSEITNALVNGLMKYTAHDVVILYGCVLSGTDPGVRSITAGAIYYDGEIYLVDAATFTTTGSQIPVWTLVESYPSGTVIFSDGSTNNVFAERKFVITNGPAGGSGVTGYIADYNAVTVKTSPFSSPIGEVKMFAGSTSGVFDTTGLGSGVWSGWALCNGQNSTVDLRGRFIVGLSNADGTNYAYTNSEKNVSDYNAIGKVGGEQKHLLLSTESGVPDHEHITRTDLNRTSSGNNEGPSPGGGVNNTNIGLGVIGGPVDAVDPHENRPPFYTLAFVQKISN